MTNRIPAIVTALLLSCGSAPVIGQAFPLKAIRILASDPGGGSDFGARLVAQGITGPLGQPVIVQNQGGASGIVAAQTVARATPDGYTLLFYANSFWLAQLLQENVPYDPVRDYAPITLAISSPGILVVHPNVAAKSVKDLITVAKSKPGMLNYGSGGPGTASHLAAELFNSMAGVSIVRIPFKGSGPALNGVIGNQVQLMFGTATGSLPHVKSGRLNALAVTSALPSALAPGLPTVAASGLPGYESISAYGIFAPAKTPAPVIARLNREIVQFLKQPEVKERLLASGAESAGSQPQELAAMMRSDIAKIGKLLKETGIRLE